MRTVCVFWQRSRAEQWFSHLRLKRWSQDSVAKFCLYIIGGVYKVLVIYCNHCTRTPNSPLGLMCLPAIPPLSTQPQLQGMALGCIFPLYVTFCKEILILSWSTFEHSSYSKMCRASQGSLEETSLYKGMWKGLHVQQALKLAAGQGWVDDIFLKLSRYGKESE